MDNRSNYNFAQTQEAPSGTLAKAFMANVFSWMFLALTVTAATAYLFGTNMELLRLLFNEAGTGFSPLGYFVIFSPIAFVLVINLGMARMSMPVIALLFMLFSV